MQKYFSLIWTDKIFFTAGHSQKRTTSKRAGLTSETSAGPRMEQNEWTVRTFPASASAKWKVKGSVACSDHRQSPDNGSLIPAPRAPPKSSSDQQTEDVWRRLQIDGWQASYRRPLPSSEISRIHQMLYRLSGLVGGLWAGILPAPHCLLLAWHLAAADPQCDQNIRFCFFPWPALWGRLPRPHRGCFTVYWHFSTVFLITIFQSWLLC